MDELNVQFLEIEGFFAFSAATLAVAGDQYEVTVAQRGETGREPRWHIRQDSLIWKD